MYHYETHIDFFKLDLYYKTLALYSLTNENDTNICA